MSNSYQDFRQIDDIIDARKKLGQFNVGKSSNTLNCRYHYSNTSAANEKFIRFDDTAFPNDGDYLTDLKPSDSEITIVRVRGDGLTFKRRPSKWDMHDIAIPGDGSHLGESPSMVNLATLVQQKDEYLVPLSSWDPYYTSENILDCSKMEKLSDEDCSVCASQASNENSLSVGSKGSVNLRRSTLASKISRFLKNHCKKSKRAHFEANHFDLHKK